MREQTRAEEADDMADEQEGYERTDTAPPPSRHISDFPYLEVSTWRIKCLPSLHALITWTSRTIESSRLSHL
ncbi:hypothetical protein Y032_0175g490 [Ancylostoma ceylanicum]|uniref:Uncharacterized protein n=1 Tax=Ancylostoma ceylanicum TaxID=53326 RepID=A0A016SUP8_9BILA|nr:hypothetical protein Y032_0175g490 [Ancylostoma ceylanicum]